MDGTGSGIGQVAPDALPAEAEGRVVPAEPQTPLASDPPQLPRGASGSELDSLRVSLRKAPRTAEARGAVLAKEADDPASPLALVVRGEGGRLLDQTIDEGRALLDSDPAAAHKLFERAWVRNTNDARVLSHYGLTLVRVEGDRQRGIRFCEEAVRRFPRSSEFLINLARALVETRNKEQAVRALNKAQSLDPSDPQVRQAFEALGLRRPPVIGFLPRNFILNRWLGRLTWLFAQAPR